MSKVLTFSRVFPAYHPKAGMPTYFIEKVLNSILPKGENGIIDRNWIHKDILPLINDFVLLDGESKDHTIRAGHRFKAGDWFSPRVWSGKPYASKQIQFAPDIQVKKTWDVRIWFDGETHSMGINGLPVTHIKMMNVADNDGLDIVDFRSWFSKLPFTGQIICWSDQVEY